MAADTSTNSSRLGRSNYSTTQATRNALRPMSRAEFIDNMKDGRRGQMEGLVPPPAGAIARRAFQAALR